LFYNYTEWKQINTIEKVLSQDKHLLVIKQLEDNGLGKGIAILFNGFSGTGKTATVQEAEAMNKGIRAAIATNYQSLEISESISILYVAGLKLISFPKITPV
jgi:triosephosphate isomerase